MDTYVDTIKKYLVKFSSKGLYIGLLLLYAFKNKNTPGWAKKVIFGAFAYVLNPFDSIPDLTPFLGMTDDLGVITFSLVTIACYVDDSVKEKAKDQLKTLLDTEIEPEIIDEVHSWL